ncbi:MAG: hypothetical protein SV760_00430, partial [Halobacteria archaeon]|nr:hypothetical protein [Halobacteria archaeon]
MNKSNAMGFVLLVLGTALALTVGTSSSKIALPLGFLGATALVYMGIGLYSRGNTRTGELRTSDDEDRGRSLGRTATYVST